MLMIDKNSIIRYFSYCNLFHRVFQITRFSKSEIGTLNCSGYFNNLVLYMTFEKISSYKIRQRGVFGIHFFVSAIGEVVTVNSDRRMIFEFGLYRMTLHLTNDLSTQTLPGCIHSRNGDVYWTIR